MAKPSGTGGQGSRRRHSFRVSLSNEPAESQSQTQGRDPDGTFARRQKAIKERLAAVEEATEPEDQEPINLLEFQPELATEVAVTFQDETGNDVLVPTAQLESLSAFKLRDQSKATPEGVHSVIRHLYFDHRMALHQLEGLQSAYDLNLEKYQNLSKQADRLESDNAALEKQLEELAKLPADEASKKIAENLQASKSKYKEMAVHYRTQSKDAEAKIKELEANITQLKEQESAESQDMDEALAVLRNDNATLTKKLEKANKKLKASKDGDKRGCKQRRSLSPWSRDQRGHSNPGSDDSDSSSESDSHHSRDGSRDPPRSRDGGAPLTNIRGRCIRFDTPGADSNATTLSRIDPHLKAGMETNRGVRDPDKFGADGEPEFDEWLGDVDNKLGVTTFQSKDQSMSWLLSKTKGEVRALLKPRVPTRLSSYVKHSSMTDMFASIEEMIDLLIDRFGQRDVSNKSFLELAKLKQSEKQTFTEHYTKFQRLRACVSMTEENEMQTLENSLSYRYQNRLVSGAPPETLKELVKTLYHIENGFTRLDMNKPPPKKDGNTGNSNGGGNGNGNGGRNRGGGGRGNGGQNNSNLLPYADLPDKYKNLKPLSEDQRRELIRSDKCLRCREPGHHSRDPVCILKKYAGPNANSMTASTSDTTAGNTAGTTQNQGNA